MDANAASNPGQAMQSLLRPGQLNNSQLSVTMTPNSGKSLQTKGPQNNFTDKQTPADNPKFRYVKLPDGRVLQVSWREGGREGGREVISFLMASRV